ncbi:transcription initiation factor IIB family protein, partial [Candidatus Woesearchaeota archaeon]|nr:transcription initiation factor IIB family protein [Candidatus Woesearchaeota archaeon]
LLSGRSPKGIAAGALYVASRIMNGKKTQAEIAKVTDVTEVTVRNTYKQFIDNLDYLNREMKEAQSY